LARRGPSGRLKKAMAPVPWCRTPPILDLDASHSTVKSLVKSGRSLSKGVFELAKGDVRLLRPTEPLLF
jgi:hypothetical protein